MCILSIYILTYCTVNIWAHVEHKQSEYGRFFNTHSLRHTNTKDFDKNCKINPAMYKSLTHHDQVEFLQECRTVFKKTTKVIHNVFNRVFEKKFHFNI